MRTKDDISALINSSRFSFFKEVSAAGSNNESNVDIMLQKNRQGQYL